MNEPRILFWDLETGYNLVTVFDLFNYGRPITYKAIQQERYIICGSFKELGKKQIKTVSLLDTPAAFEADPTNDFYLIQSIHEILKDADVIIAHNGDNFDLKYFNTRAVFHGLGPIPDIIKIDTYKLAKKKFRFNSNRLDYLAHFLGVGEKYKINGKIWLDCLHGKKKAVREMIKYNKVDVDVLEQVYLKLAPYDVAKLNMNLFSGGELVCPLCRSDKMIKDGTRYTRTVRYQRYKCKDCLHYFQARISDKSEPPVEAK